MKKSLGLGRGLDALIYTTHVATSGSSSINEIPLKYIYANPDQPRHDFDQEALEELANSIKEHGVISPITLRKNANNDYMIIAGERRYRASKMAGLETIPAYVRTAKDEQVMEWALIENIQREDLNAIEIALGMQRLIEECGLTQEAMADKVGKKRSTVGTSRRLLTRPDEVQYAIKSGLISMGHAKAIAGAEGENQLKVLKKCLKKALSVRPTEELVRQLSTKVEQTTTPTDEEEYPESYLRLVERLEQLFSSEIAIKRSKSGGGKITIGFADDAEIEQFISRLG